MNLFNDTAYILYFCMGVDILLIHSCLWRAVLNIYSLHQNADSDWIINLQLCLADDILRYYTIKT